MGILGCWVLLCHNQVSTMCPTFVFTHMYPHLCPYKTLNDHMIQSYAIFPKLIFFWDTLYLPCDRISLIFSLTDKNFKSDILYLGASQIMSNFFMRIYLKLSCQISIHHIYPVVLSISCLIKDCYHHIITYLQHQNILFHSYCLQVPIELISRLSFNCDDMQLIIVDNLEIL